MRAVACRVRGEQVAATAAAAGGGRFVLSLFNPGCFMRLDATAQRALHVLPSRAVGPLRVRRAKSTEQRAKGHVQ